jgi:hypothetical protein
MPYQEYNMPLDVIATRADLAADRSVAVPSSISVDMSLLKCQESFIKDKLGKLTFGQWENTHSKSHLAFPRHRRY